MSKHRSKKLICSIISLIVIFICYFIIIQSRISYYLYKSNEFKEGEEHCTREAAELEKKANDEKRPMVAEWYRKRAKCNQEEATYLAALSNWYRRAASRRWPALPPDEPPRPEFSPLPPPPELGEGEMEIH
jgi:hypothetical protein